MPQNAVDIELCLRITNGKPARQKMKHGRLACWIGNENNSVWLDAKCSLNGFWSLL
jgi:hypothetical protein